MSNEPDNYNFMNNDIDREIIKSFEHSINPDVTVWVNWYNFEESAEYVGLTPIEFYELCVDLDYEGLTDHEILNSCHCSYNLEILLGAIILPAKERENRINLIIESDAKSNLML